MSQLSELKAVRGPALAIVADHVYDCMTVSLQAGDEVLMYTDGICEAMNASKDEFGVEHLQETIQDYNTLPLNELVLRLVEVVRDHAGSKKLGDDVCLLGFTLKALGADGSS